MKNYFLYELKKSLPFIGFLSIGVTAVYVADIALTQSPQLIILNLAWISGMGGLLAACIPVWAFKYKMKKRSTDLYYALPISHVKILTVKFLIGLIAVFVPYTLSFFFGTFAVLIKHIEGFNAVYYIPQYFASLIPIYIIYALACFAFTRANKVSDGVSFIVFWAFAVALVMYVLDLLSAKPVSLDEQIYFRSTHYIFSSYYLPFAPLDQTTAFFETKIYPDLNSAITTDITPLKAAVINQAIGFSLTALMGIGATVGLFLFERRAKAENAEQISNSFFGYKVMIPLYTVCITAISSVLSYISILIFVLVTLGAYALYARYMRKFKIGWKAFAVLVASLIAGTVLGLLI